MQKPMEHFVYKTPLLPPFPSGSHLALFGMGCFWGVERIFWQQEGVISTAVGYSAGHWPEPTYEQVCSGKTGHNEVVQIVFDPQRLTYDRLLKIFWENHDPTQGMRQGHDVGSQYRSGIYTFSDEQEQRAWVTKALFQPQLDRLALGRITTEIATATPFFYAEPDHQQYLAKNPQGYCGLGGIGISCPI